MYDVKPHPNDQILLLYYKFVLFKHRNAKKRITKKNEDQSRKPFVQTKPIMITRESQTDPVVIKDVVGVLSLPNSPIATSTPYVSEGESTPLCQSDGDKTFNPDDTYLSFDSDDSSASNRPADEKKYIVFEAQLLSLFTKCQSCNAETKGKIVHRIGTFIVIHKQCRICDYTKEWSSQSMVRDTPAGNMLMSASLLYSGSCMSKSLRMLKFLNLVSISERTFYRHQDIFLHPCITTVWHNER
ncbi:uncharacterized protein LOC117120412 [Anneissia japonica]|uniref:uncharacterized protein LOC117120412 n=1 Tax=Anneissia japonica TaxID=1529436 RepID=UPI001425B716|nr:uncharacterized protein LOC117120412 [Anneissia japonica]